MPCPRTWRPLIGYDRSPSRRQMSARLRHTSAHEQPSWRRHGKRSCPRGLVSGLVWSAALVGWARMGHGPKGLWTGADLGPAQSSQLLRAVSVFGDSAKGDSRAARPIHSSSHDGGAQRSDLVCRDLERATASAYPDQQGRRGYSGVGLTRTTGRSGPCEHSGHRARAPTSQTWSAARPGWRRLRPGCRQRSPVFSSAERG
jgi:hypothetical protein